MSGPWSLKAALSKQCPAPTQPSFGKLADLYSEGGNTGHKESSHSLDTDIFDSAFNFSNSSQFQSANIVYQNTQNVGGSDSLFYVPVKVGGKVTLGGMLDSGSMACTVSDTARCNLLSAGAVCEADRFSTDVTHWCWRSTSASKVSILH